jgi:hypothetical protein
MVAKRLGILCLCRFLFEGRFPVFSSEKNYEIDTSPSTTLKILFAGKYWKTPLKQKSAQTQNSESLSYHAITKL